MNKNALILVDYSKFDSYLFVKASSILQVAVYFFCIFESSDIFDSISIIVYFMRWTFSRGYCFPVKVATVLYLLLVLVL